jgi:hypothetical protein
VSDPGSERRGHLEAVYDLVEEAVIPEVGNRIAPHVTASR